MDKIRVIIADDQTLVRQGIRGLLALVGLVGLPLLYFSVYRWSLYYGTSNRSLPAPTGETSIIATGLFVMTLGLFAYTAAATLTRLRNEILKRERANATWVGHPAGALRPDPAAELAESEAKLEPMRHALRTPAPAS